MSEAAELIEKARLRLATMHRRSSAPGGDYIEDQPIRIEFGRTRLSAAQVASLDFGSVIQLDERVDEPVQVFVGGKLFARGQAVEVDGRLGVRICEIIEAGSPV